jgi:hypothetical protein
MDFSNNCSPSPSIHIIDDILIPRGTYKTIKRLQFPCPLNQHDAMVQFQAAQFCRKYASYWTSDNQVNSLDHHGFNNTFSLAAAKEGEDFNSKENGAEAAYSILSKATRA